MSTAVRTPSIFARKTLFGATVGAALTFMIVGVIFWGGFNTGMEVTNTMEFCISCHEMEENVYREYQGTVHDGNRSGVRAGCPDCHVPRPWIHKIVRKLQASNEVFHKIMGTVSTPEKFESQRLVMARRVWDAMKSTDSRECRNCHDWGTMNPEKQKPRARQQHLFAMEKGNTCIDCHKGIAHKPIHKTLSEDELEKLAEPRPDYARPVPATFQAGMERAAAAELKAETEQKEQAKKEQEAREAAKKAAKEAEDARLQAAVAKALTQAAPATAAGAPTAPMTTPAVPETAPAAGGAEFGVDWSGKPDRTITLLFPGPASMEWTLKGAEHGGARPFKAGDRCFTCHDKETGDMGKKIISGEKKTSAGESLETQLIPGKRGGIPVKVQAAHDADYLYMRFEWEQGEHTPVPFVDGGKMDPENPMKLAIMFATDDVMYAGQAGCWGTCHADANYMPGQPAKDAAPNGVTKYITESRTEVEVKGSMGKPLGGWDKRKPEADVAGELAAGHFMDLLRYKSGKGEAEDGHILEDRHMSGGQGVEFNARQEGAVWVVEMRRKLKSDKPGDVSIEAGKLYNFGFAIHDDHTASRFHHVSLGYKLGLDNDTAEVNAVAK